MRFRSVIAVVALSAAAVTAAVLMSHGGTDIARSAEIVSSSAGLDSQITRQLGPNTALHEIERAYERQGPIAPRLASEGGALYTPEWTETEGRVEFDSAGDFSFLHSEKRGLDGTVYQRAWVEKGELVIYHVADGSERRVPHRSPESLATVESYKAFRLEATAAWFDQIGGTVREADVGGEAVWVVERVSDKETLGFATGVESPSAAPPDSEAPFSYTLPYVADLDLEKRVARWIIRRSDSFLVRYELVGIDGEGREHLLKSRERVVYEVTSSDS